jgi:hypothetical protein
MSIPTPSVRAIDPGAKKVSAEKIVHVRVLSRLPLAAETDPPSGAGRRHRLTTLSLSPAVLEPAQAVTLTTARQATHAIATPPSEPCRARDRLRPQFSLLRLGLLDEAAGGVAIVKRLGHAGLRVAGSS